MVVRWRCDRRCNSPASESRVCGPHRCWMSTAPRSGPPSPAAAGLPWNLTLIARCEGAMLFPTSLVGSYPQPEWLIDRARLAGRFPPRVRALELWRIPEVHLQEAMDDATIVAIKAQEDAG